VAVGRPEDTVYVDGVLLAGGTNVIGAIGAVCASGEVTRVMATGATVTGQTAMALAQLTAESNATVFARTTAISNLILNVTNTFHIAGDFGSATGRVDWCWLAGTNTIKSWALMADNTGTVQFSKCQTLGGAITNLCGPWNVGTTPLLITGTNYGLLPDSYLVTEMITGGITNLQINAAVVPR